MSGVKFLVQVWFNPYTMPSRDVGLQHAHAIAFRIEKRNVPTDSRYLHRFSENLAAGLIDPFHRGHNVIHRDDDRRILGWPIALAKSNKIELLAGSSFDRAFDPSRVLVERHLECPELGEPGFRARFEALLRRHAVDLVFPTIDAVVAEFAGWRDPIARLVTSLPDSATLVLSKRQTYQHLEGHVAVPRIFHGQAPLPCYAKPDSGSGSRGGFLVETAQDLDLARRRSLLVHELLPGPEYTVDCLSGLDGGLMFANVRVRGQVARGISVGTTGLCRPDIEDSVRRIAARIPLRGPWFAQFKEARDGTPTLLEVNARVSGSMTLPRLFEEVRGVMDKPAGVSALIRDWDLDPAPLRHDQ